MRIGGYDLYLSREINPDEPIDYTREGWQVRLTAWKVKLGDAWRSEGAWGVIVQRPDCDYRLFDQATAAAGYGTRAWLILHREVRA